MKSYELWRRGLFYLDAERAHHLVMKTFATALSSASLRKRVRKRMEVSSPVLSQRLWGIDFPNPLGMAAGFDKDGSYFNALSALGFGHIEVGTVTALAQEGNERPRLFRLPEDEGLLNRMGFNNRGSETLAHRLEGASIEPILGINIGKSKTTPLSDAASDYLLSLRRVIPYADYLVVNVSSPNTPGLRTLQGEKRLRELLVAVRRERDRLLLGAERQHVPLLLKVAPDLSQEALEEVVEVVKDCGVDGVVATNTTVERARLKTPGQGTLGGGGVSGRPLTMRSREVVQEIYRQTKGEIPIIGVGGVFDGEDAFEMIAAGASLVQIWTGFVYGGPGAPRKILQGLVNRMKRESVGSIDELRGSAT